MLKGISLPAVLINVGTTGSNVTRDRIIEIAIIEIYENEIREWSTLINPNTRIPLSILHRSGITEDMLASAPRFEQVAKEILLRVKDKLFIAYNVRFDYGFLRNEFSRLAYSFKANLVCTSKLSRNLYRDCDDHDLEKIKKRHGIDVPEKQRVFDKVKATYKFLETAAAEHGDEKLHAAIKAQTGKASLPPALNPALINSLPNEPGVYYFWGQSDELLYVGKSINIRKRVLSHFTSDHTSSKEMRICQQIRHITFDTTAGELSALILESQKIKELQPLFNRKLRRPSKLHSIYLEKNIKGWLTPTIVSINSIPGLTRKLYGLFPSEKKAKDSIKFISDEFNLCYHACGLETITKRPCMRYQLKKCNGLCAGTEHIADHNLRMQSGFEKLSLKTWPYKGPIALIESNQSNQKKQHLLINNWCVLGTALSTVGYSQVFTGRVPLVLDKDIYKYLLNAMSSKSSNLQIRQINFT